jgi:hypothetical protein
MLTCEMRVLSRDDLEAEVRRQRTLAEERRATPLV